MDLLSGLYAFIVAGYAHTGILVVFVSILLFFQLWLRANQLDQNVLLWLVTGLLAYGIGANIGHSATLWFLVEALNVSAQHTLVTLAWDIPVLLPLQLNLPGYAAILGGFAAYSLAGIALSLVLRKLDNGVPTKG